MTEFDTAPSNAQLVETATVEMRPPRILLAEDDYELRTLLVEALEVEGYEVVPAADGFDLLDRIGDTWLAEDGFDLVLSDIRMPGCTGLKALEALRERDWSTPIVFMTAFGSIKTHGEAQGLGATIVDKPFDLDDLIDLVRAIVPPSRYELGWH